VVGGVLNINSVTRLVRINTSPWGYKTPNYGNKWLWFIWQYDDYNYGDSTDICNFNMGVANANTQVLRGHSRNPPNNNFFHNGWNDGTFCIEIA